MPCYKPVTGYFDKDGRFTQKETDLPGEIPCGKCIGCRLDRAQEWSIRCWHESQLHWENSFVTLTYDNDHVPKDYSINPEHLTKFIRSLRKKNRDTKIRYYGVGEYGEQTLRPHYHVLLFGFEPKDKVIYGENKQGDNQYESEYLDAIWKKGKTITGNVTMQSAGYCARYIMKKIGGDLAEKHYQRVNPLTGELHQVLPEFARMSTKPGIAHEWFKKFKTDVYPSDFVTNGGRKIRPPRYYDKLYEKADPEGFEQLKAERRKDGYDQRWNSTDERLAVRKEVKESRIGQLSRNSI